MSPETTAKMLERVRALLAKAESTTFPEEADTFRAKADELMTRHAIDQWMVEQAQHAVGARPEPVRRDFARTWGGSKFRADLFAMFCDVARHCRCAVGTRGLVYSGGEDGYGYVPVYGLPSDLDYLDMLFTTLNLEVAKNLQPPVDPAGEVGHEVFKQRQAGIGWTDITRKMYAAGLIAPTTAQVKKYNLPAEPLAWETLRNVAKPSYSNVLDGTMNTSRWFNRGDLGDLATEIKNRLANANRRYVREHGLEMDRNYVKPEVYQRSFMWGFVEEVERRLREMRRASASAYDADHATGSMALATRDIYSQAVALYEAAYPPPPPVQRDPNAKPAKLPKLREVAFDSSAMAAGARKAREADLANPASRRMGNRRGLPEG